MKLRPYQDAAVASVRAAWESGKACPLLVAPTGAGKTEMAKALLSEFRSPCVIVHTDVLFEQTARRIPNARVYTVQSLVAGGDSGDMRRAGLARHDACFIDECFVASTIIEPVGDVFIISSRDAPETLVEIDGVVSTPDHPYLTSEGWKRAEQIIPGELCCVRRALSAEQPEQATQDLLPKVSLPEIELDYVRHQQASRICKAEGLRQHDSQAWGTREPERLSEANESSASGAGRERPWRHVAGVDPDASVWADSHDVDDGGWRATFSLQVGPCMRAGEAFRRGRWREPLRPEGESCGRQEDAPLGWQRVGRVAIHQRGGVGRYAEVCPDGRVYNIETSSGVYFAGGRLVHNCHHIASNSWRQALPHLNHMRRFGATATPKRADGTPLGDIFDALVVAAKYSELVAAGFLVRCDVWSPDIGRKRQRKEKLRPDGVAAYLEHAKRADGSWRPGIHFETTIESCEAASARYREAGLRSAVVCKDTCSRERRRIFDAYSSGDLDMLCSPTALAEGFDSPRAEVCVLRRSCDHVGDWLQRVGRVLRPAPGKERALLIDCCDTRSKHGLPTDDRSYYLDGAGIEAEKLIQEPLLDPEEDEQVVRIRLEYEAVQAKYRIVRDTLIARYQALAEEAAELGYKPSWAFRKFKEQTGIDMPMAFAAKFKSVCKACNKRLTVGDGIFWIGPSHVEHQECWIRKLDGEALDGVELALEMSAQ